MKMIAIFIFLMFYSFISHAQTAEVNYKKVPVLIGSNKKPVIQIKIQADAQQELKLGEIEMVVNASIPLKQIKAIRVFSSGKNPVFKDSVLIGQITTVKRKNKIALSHETKSVDYFWIVIDLAASVNLLENIELEIAKITLVNNAALVLTSKLAKRQYKLGQAVRSRFQDGVSVYRIPGIVKTDKGTLISVYDNRNKSHGDLQNDIDVGMSRSTDGGQTWEPMKVIMDMGTYGGLSHNANGIGDPSVLFDNKTNTIWVAAVWQYGHENKKGFGWDGTNGVWMTSQPGFEPEKTGQVMLVKSIDDGKTWSHPINITTQVKDSLWRLIFAGPGAGICMKDGTLVFPAQFALYDKDYVNLRKNMSSTIFYSKDHGVTWHTGTFIKSGTNEAQVVELSDGSLMLNARNAKNGNIKDATNGRAVYVTRDLGKTWMQHPTSNSVLQDSDCQASILGIENVFTRKRVLLFSNPDTKYGRNHMTVKASFDDGLSWPEKNQVLYDEDEGLGYSCLVQIDKKTFGVIYEGWYELYFVKFRLQNFLK